MGFLDRLRIAVHRREFDELAIEAGLMRGPQLFHRPNIFARHRPSAAILNSHHLGFQWNTARADSKQHPAARAHIERRDRLGQPDWLALGNQTDSGAEFDPPGNGAGLRQQHEGIGDGSIVFGHLMAADADARIDPCGSKAMVDGKNRMVADPHRFEAQGLAFHRHPIGRHRVGGNESSDSDSHR